VTRKTKKQGYKRGYPVAVLMGLEESSAALWQVFSNVVKPYASVKLEGRRKDEGRLYSFHESIVNALRPILNEGVRSIVVAAPARTSFASLFFEHVRRHHAYLVQGNGSNVTSFRELTGSACQIHEVASLVKTETFHKLIGESTSEEADGLMETLENRLNVNDGSAIAVFSLEEAEDLIYSQGKRGTLRPDYLMLTDRYLADSKNKNRIHRLLQISKNKNIKTRVVNAETLAGKRLSQLGGLVCLAKTEQSLFTPK
jgi:stalled ribosome rescue protein Dom34